MKELSLAIRNLLRNRRRSLATLLALAIGSSSILLFGGFSSNIRYTMLTAYVRYGGHLQIQHRDFFLYGSGNPTAYGIEGAAKLIAEIQRDDVLKNLVLVVSPMLQLSGIAGNYEAAASRTVVGTGLVAEDISQMRLWNEFAVPLQSPAFVLQGAPQDAAILGTGVARVLLLCDVLAVRNCPTPEKAKAATGPAMPADIADLAAAETKPAAGAPPARSRGARIDLLVGQARGTPNVAALNVLAAEAQGFKEFDEVAVILHLAQAQQLVYGKAAPKATAVIVQLHKTAYMAPAADRLRQLLDRVAPGAPLGIRNFEELNPFYVQTLQLFDLIFGFIFVLIGAIVLFTVGNTMSAAVVERTVEIGTLRAVGLRQSGIQRLFVIEGLLLGCVGALVGLVAAVLIGAVINRLGLTWLPPGSSERLPLNLRVWGETPMLLGTTAVLILISAVSAWWPAWRAARLNIVEALRHA